MAFAAACAIRIGLRLVALGAPGKHQSPTRHSQKRSR